MDLNKECGNIDLYEKNENSENNFESEKKILNQENERIDLNKENKYIDFVNVKLTQKNSKNCVQYQVPDDYRVETEVSKFKIRCETKYQQNNKVRFTIIWKENNSEWSIYSERSATNVINEFLKKKNYLKSNLSGTFIFGFYIGQLHKHRLDTSTALSITSINKKKPNQPIVHLRKIELDFNGESIILNYKSPNEKNELNKIDAIVRACDESLLARDGYRQLAAIEPYLTQEYSIANCRIEITNEINKDIKIGTFNIDKNENLFDNLENLEKSDEDIIINNVEIGNGVYRSIDTLLKILIPIWKQETPAIIKPGDILKLKLGGDGRNVGCKQSHVMMTICLLNEGNEYLFIHWTRLFEHQLFDLKNNGIYDKDVNTRQNIQKTKIPIKHLVNYVSDEEPTSILNVCQGCHLSEEVNTKKSKYNLTGKVKDCIVSADIEHLKTLPIIEGIYSSRRRAPKKRRTRSKNSPDSLRIYTNYRFAEETKTEQTNEESATQFSKKSIIISEAIITHINNIETDLEDWNNFEIFTDGSLQSTNSKRYKTKNRRGNVNNTMSSNNNSARNNNNNACDIEDHETHPKLMGIGIIIEFTTSNQETYTKTLGARVTGNPSSTRAELWAILVALKLLPYAATATIKTDSQASIVITDLTKKKNLKVNYVKVKAHVRTAENEFADQLAKWGALQNEVINLNYDILNRQVHHRWNYHIVDSPIKEIIKTNNKVKHQTEWATLNRTIKWNNKHIQRSLSFQIIHGSKITNLITSQEDHNKRKLSIKLLNNELPTKKRLHERKPLIYTDSICVSCNKLQKDNLHVFTCNGFANTLRNGFMDYIINKVTEIKGNTKKQLITNVLKTSNFAKIDVLRQIRAYNFQDSFSFIDIICDLIPKQLQKNLTRIINKTEVKKTIFDTFMKLRDKKWKKWIARCENFLKWENDNNIMKEEKRRKERLIRQETIKYKKSKENLKKTCILIRHKILNNFFLEGYGLHDLFYNIDECGVLISSE
ncbi:hypothetical protein Glove_547g28 [Diversispora epigaea]|uniref:Uncharacterized protein n=1 Tax=Diversispora epigaea TaxID=1348612 RepID=A0A397GC36_9GLOM|nr:hypothetical protein Glove_547g28 [Diversispora epigaea]